MGRALTIILLVIYSSVVTFKALQYREEAKKYKSLYEKILEEYKVPDFTPDKNRVIETKLEKKAKTYYIKKIDTVFVEKKEKVIEVVPPSDTLKVGVSYTLYDLFEIKDSLFIYSYTKANAKVYYKPIGYIDLWVNFFEKRPEVYYFEAYLNPRELYDDGILRIRATHSLRKFRGYLGLGVGVWENGKIKYTPIFSSSLTLGRNLLNWSVGYKYFTLSYQYRIY